MKRGLWVIAAMMVLTFVFGRAGYAFWGADNKKAATPVKAAPASKAAVATAVEPEAPAVEAKEAKAPVVKQPSAADLEKQRVARDKKKAQINNNQWDVEISALSGKGAKQEDVLIFRDNKFASSAFAKSGFSPSNYTLTVADDGTSVVETMQSSEKEGIIFWRVEMDKDLASCKGILSRQLADNKTEDFSFTSTGKKPVTMELPVVGKPEVKAEAKPGAKESAKK